LEKKKKIKKKWQQYKHVPPPVSKALCGFAMAKEQSYAAQQSSQSRRIL